MQLCKNDHLGFLLYIAVSGSIIFLLFAVPDTIVFLLLPKNTTKYDLFIQSILLGEIAWEFAANQGYL